VRYFLTFITPGIAVQLIAHLYGRGRFDLVLAAIALTGDGGRRQRGGSGTSGGATGTMTTRHSSNSGT
jgi:hypothetical protein